jgi:hypothetical protein
VLHGLHEPVAVLLWWDHCGRGGQLHLFVEILQFFEDLVRSHEINDAHPDHRLRLIDDEQQ